MADRTYSNAEIEERMWEAIEKGQHTGMLGISGDGHHFQPMTGYVDRDAGQIWFFTYKDTDLAEAAAAAGGRATFIFQSRELWACIDGTLSVDPDRSRMERYWNAHVAAWYPEGKDDPRLTMLRLDCAEAGVWIAEGGPVKYAFELAKAKATHTTPDVGARRDLNLH
jgi:general stress protein 26